MYKVTTNVKIIAIEDILLFKKEHIGQDEIKSIEPKEVVAVEIVESL